MKLHTSYFCCEDLCCSAHITDPWRFMLVSPKLQCHGNWKCLLSLVKPPWHMSLYLWGRWDWRMPPTCWDWTEVALWDTEIRLWLSGGKGPIWCKYSEKWTHPEGNSSKWKNSRLLLCYCYFTIIIINKAPVGYIYTLSFYFATAVLDKS